MSDRYKGAILSPTAPTVTPQSAGGIYTSSQQLQYQGQGVWPTAVNYPINNSLRFRSSASAYLSRTFSSGDQQKWTFSVWLKKALGRQTVFGRGSTQFGSMQFESNDTLSLNFASGGTTYFATTAQVFRDPSAWYHLVWAIDTTQATSTNRQRLYVNGTEVTAWSTYTTIPQNTNGNINTANSHWIGRFWESGFEFPFDGYMTEINFVNAVQLTPSSFGTTDAYGIWQPIPYTGAYGTNGFYLPFTDNSALTTSSNVGLGKDFSGNGNYWVTNNISITAGSTYDSMKDVPTNTNSNTANYCVLNPLGLPPSGYSAGTFASGNLQFTTGGVKIAKSTISFPTSGKWYVECRSSGTSASIDWIFGLTGMSAATPVNHSNPGVNLYVSDTAYWLLNASSQFTQAGSISSSDVFQIAYDSSTGKVWLGKNNTYYTSAGAGTGNPSSGTNEFASLSTTTEYCAYTGGNTGTTTSSINFGQQPFTYTPPSGFYPLNTYNLPTPTILDGDQYMDATTFTGNASTNVITNSGSMKPDMVWLKSRTNANSHTLYDAIRGVNTLLYPNLTNAEAVGTNQLTAFNSNGFTLGASENANDDNGESSVGWQWRASNAAGVSNTQGTITSTVSANTTAGFSVVTYTGNGTNSTVGHGLGATPSMVIVKCRSTAGESWHTYHVGLSSLANTVYLNGAAAQGSFPTCFNSMSTLNSTVFSLGTDGASNGSGRTYVAYCFSAVAGYSAFGSYTGNGSSDGPFVYLGFRPKFVLLKSSTQATDWYIYDTSRDTYNVATLELNPNLAAAEQNGTYGSMDINSNGFKLRFAGGEVNVSSQTYIYMAFAENPFKIARGR